MADDDFKPEDDFAPEASDAGPTVESIQPSTGTRSPTTTLQPVKLEQKQNFQVNPETAQENQRFMGQVAAGLTDIVRPINKGIIGLVGTLPLDDINRTALENTARHLSDTYPLLFGDPEAPQSKIESAGRIFGNVVDPVGNKILGAVSEYGIAPVMHFAQKKGWLLGAEKIAELENRLQQSFGLGEKAAIEETSKELLKNHVLESTIKGGAGGGVAASAASGISALDRGESLKQAASDAISALPTGVVFGSLLGAGASRFTGKGRLLANASKDAPIATSLNLEQNPAYVEMKQRRQDLALKEAELQARFEDMQQVRPRLTETQRAKTLQQESNLVRQKESNASKAVKANASLRADREAFTLEMQDLQKDAEALSKELSDMEQQGFDLNVEEYSKRRQQLEEKEFRYNTLAKKLEMTSLDNAQREALLESGTLPPDDHAFLAAYDAKIRSIQHRAAEIQIEYDKIHNKDMELRLSREPQTAPIDDLIRVSEKHQKIVEEAAILDDAIKAIPNKGLKAQPGSNVYDYIVSQSVDDALTQYEKTMTSPGLKHLVPEKRALIAQAEFENHLAQLGITKNAEIIPKTSGGLRRAVERGSYFGAKTGTRIGEVLTDSLFATNRFTADRNAFRVAVHGKLDELERLGISPEQAGEMLQYMENGQWNPAAKDSPALTRPAWTHADPPAQVQQLLAGIEQDYNKVHGVLVNTGVLDPRQQVTGYLPLIKKQGVPPTAGRSQRGIESPTLAESRELGFLNPEIHETNLRTITDRYGNSAYVSAYYRPILRQAAREQMKLNLMGQNKVSDWFGKTMKENLNIKEDLDLRKVFAEDLKDQHTASIAQALNEQGAPEGALKEVLNELEKIWYTKNVSLNPKTNVLQVLQPEFTLMPEVGPKNYLKARLSIGKSLLNKDTSQRYSRLAQQSIREDLPAFEELGSQSKTGVGKALGLVSKGLKKLSFTFSTAEKINRFTAYKAADIAFDDAIEKLGPLGLNELTKTLSTGEQAYVLNAGKRSLDAAKDAYALVIDRRANFYYGLADKPELLRSGMGKYFKFTTYLSNMAERYANDLARGNYQQFAQRVALPLATAGILSELTQKDFEQEANIIKQGFNQVENPTINPFVTSFIKGGYELSKAIQNDDASEFLKEELINSTPVWGKVRQKLENGESPSGLKDLEDDTVMKKVWKKLVGR